MKTRHVPASEALPRNLADLDKDGLAEWIGDIRITPHSRLRAGVAFFRNRTRMRKFWRAYINDFNLGRECCGAVNALGYVLEDTKTRERINYVDPTYFCFIALSIPDLRMEVVCHESVHAGFCYAKRVGGRYDHFTDWVDFHTEEAVCYPAGRVAYGINVIAHDEGFYR